MGLLYKLIQMHVPAQMIEVTDSYLAHRAFRVRMDGAVSGWRAMAAGVPQGSTLSPKLYNMYTSDIFYLRAMGLAKTEFQKLKL